MKTNSYIFTLFIFMFGSNLAAQAPGPVVPKKESTVLEELNERGYVMLNKNKTLLTNFERVRLIELFKQINDSGMKASPSSQANTHLFLFYLHKGAASKKFFSLGSETIYLTQEIVDIADRFVKILELQNKKVLVEVTLMDNFARRFFNEPVICPWHISWHQDKVAGSSHPFIAVVNLEVNELPCHEFLLGTLYKTTSQDKIFEITEEHAVMPFNGYIISEFFEPNIYHATSLIENGCGLHASRKSLVLRIVDEESEHYWPTMQHYSEHNLNCIKLN